MIKEKIVAFLEKKLAKKKYEVIKLQWQKAELEKLLYDLKRQKVEKDLQEG